jgi:hypothetical protein
MMSVRTSRRWVIAALCGVGLLTQAVMLPLAHLDHVAQLGARHATLAPEGGGNGQRRVAIRRCENAPAHDATTCRLCVALAHGRAGVAAVAVTAPLPQAVLGVSAAAIEAHRAVDRSRVAAPRAPPLFSA